MRRLGASAASWASRIETKTLLLQILLGVVVVVLGSVWYHTLNEFETEHARVSAEILELKATEEELPPRLPSIALAIGSIIADAAFLNALLIRRRLSAAAKMRLTQTSLWIAAIGVLIAWVPTDFAFSQSALFGKGFIGERPSQWAYVGKLVLITLFVISFPVAARIHYRSSLLDQYVIRGFITPFSFCLIGFVAIWLIADLTDNGPNLIGANFGTVLRFYVIQLPFMILFVMPVTLLLSLLYSLSRMSKSNEIISMLGAGRSMMRVLRPLFVFGLYASLICLVFKYQWAPQSAGYKEALLEEINQQNADKRRGSKRTLDNPWSKVGHYYKNEVDNRSWWISKVPYDMQRRPLNGVALWQFDADGKPVMSFRANSAKWFHGTHDWRFSNGKTYIYDKDGVPRVQSWDFLTIPDWRETPWKVLSTAQNPEFMGIPGLTTYLKSNSDLGERTLAPFRTNWWYCWAEPMSCLVMVLIAAPLGIVYSRRGVLGGVASSIIVFALIYFLSGSFVAAGQAGILPPFLAAWATNFIFGAVGAVLLWSRARNRELPTPKILLSRFRARRTAAATR
jgi:lipopolysaccharide export system permease protein